MRKSSIFTIFSIILSLIYAFASFYFDLNIFKINIQYISLVLETLILFFVLFFISRLLVIRPSKEIRDLNKKIPKADLNIKNFNQKKVEKLERITEKKEDTEKQVKERKEVDKIFQNKILKELELFDIVNEKIEAPLFSDFPEDKIEEPRENDFKKEETSIVKENIEEPVVIEKNQKEKKEKNNQNDKKESKEKSSFKELDKFSDSF